MITLVFSENHKLHTGDVVKHSKTSFVISTGYEEAAVAISKGYEILELMPDMKKFCLYENNNQISIWLK